MGYPRAECQRPRARGEKRLVKHVPTLGIEPRVSHRNFAACEGAHRNLAKARKRIARRNEQAHRARIEDQRLQTGKFARLTNERDIDQPLLRSEESRVGKEWVSTCRSRWWRYH